MSDDFTFYRAAPTALLEVSGEDSPGFLQSQFSNDLRVPPGRVVAGLWLDHRGRLHGESAVLRKAEESYLLVSFGTPEAGLRKRLESYVIADEVEFSAAGNFLKALLIEGGRGENWIRGRFDGAFPERDRFVYSKGHYLMRDPWRVEGRWWWIGPPVEVEDLANEALAAGGRVLSDAEWTHARLAHAWPLIPAEAGPGETPHEAGLADWCSLQKGCYLGQEVVNRQSRLGRTTRSLVAVSIFGGDPGDVAGGIEIESEEGRVVGELRVWARSGDLVLGLALIKTKHRAESLRIRHQPTVRIQVLADV